MKVPSPNTEPLNSVSTVAPPPMSAAPMSEGRERFEGVLRSALESTFDEDAKKSTVFGAVEYALSTGGKRFRPLVCYGAGRAMGLIPEAVDPWAVALEYVHTYSLIHDDLPAMDNDDFRRGLPTTHMEFDEPTALLAGDALLTEAFGVVTRGFATEPQTAVQLVSLLCEGAGGSGMILGQAMDFVFNPEVSPISKLKQIHLLKTGQLLRLCLEGVGIIAGCSKERRRTLGSVGLNLGFAFQLKDDLLDGDKDENQSYLRYLGDDGTQEKLAEVTQKMLKDLEGLKLKSEDLQALVHFNENRDK